MKTTSNINERKKRKFRFALARLALLPLLLFRPAAGQTTYTVTDLGTLGGTFSASDNVNQRGAMAGISTFLGDTVLRGWLWNEGSLIDLGSLPAGPNNLATNVNNRLQITGVSDGAATTVDSNATCWNANDSKVPDALDGHAYVWSGGMITDLGTLGGKSSRGSWINNHGQIAGVSQIPAIDPNGFIACGGSPGSQIVRAFLYEKGGMKDIGTLGGYDSYGNAINDLGQVGGGADVTKTINPATGYPTHHPFLWTNGVMTDLGTLGGAFGFAEQVTNQGNVVGLTSLVGEQHVHAFLWKNGVMTDLGVLPGDTDSDAWSMNGAGQVVGASWTSSTVRAFILNNGLMSDLNTLISPNSGYQLAFAYWINDAGEIAAQAVVESTGETHAVLLTPSNNGVRGNPGGVGLTPPLRAQLKRRIGWARMKLLNE